MGIFTLISEILALPGQLNSLLSRIEALEKWVIDYEKAKTSQAISEAQKDSNAAETEDEIKKAADEERDALKKL